jgi:protein-S-isoprenylcysteine O-methyltransferase Ste14
MFYNGYFGIPDFVMAITAVSMFASTVRRQPGDPTYWIPFNRYSLVRYASGVLLLLISLLFSFRRDNIFSYSVALAGMSLFLAGAVFFFGAKSPLSRIIATGGEEGPELSPAGLYRFCRHPLYFGLLLCAFGIAIEQLSVAGMAVALLVVLPVVIRSVGAIDSYWRSKTGAAYAAYQKQVNALFPSRKNAWHPDTPKVMQKI